MAPLTGLQARSISVGETALATTPVGVPSEVVAETVAEFAELPDASTACTTK